MMRTQSCGDYSLLASGQSTKTFCPSCYGGIRREKSFRVSRKGDRVFGRCYRASCGYTEGIFSMNTAGTSDYKPRVYTGSTRILSTFEYNFLTHKVGLADDEITRLNARTDTDTGRIIMDVHDELGRVTGVIARAYDNQSPKQLTYAPINLSFVGTPKDTLVLVEDLVSAVKVARFVPAVTVLGSTINDDCIAKFVGMGIKNLYIALDKDATHKAKSAMNKYGIFFNKFIVLPVDKDPKDCTMNELQQLLGDIK